MNISETIILGVISGILTTAFIYLCISIFNKILIPWYRSAIYGGIDMSGTWDEQVEHEGATDHIRLILNQKDRTISGTMTVTKQLRQNEEVTTKTLNLTGEFQDGYLLLTGTNVNPKIQSLTTFLLRVSRAGSSLLGESSWVDANNGRIASRKTELQRNGV